VRSSVAGASFPIPVASVGPAGARPGRREEPCRPCRGRPELRRPVRARGGTAGTRGVRDDPEGPAVDAHDQPEHVTRIAAGEEQDDRGHDHQHAEHAGGPDVEVADRPRHAPGAVERGEDHVVRDREQPPFHERLAPREPLGIRHLELGGIVGRRQRERWIAVGGERAVGVERHAPAPAQDADVELEDAARIAAGDQDREEGDDRQPDEREPQEEQHDVVRDGEQPLDQPQPAAQRLTELGLDHDGMRLLGDDGRGVRGGRRRGARRGRHGACGRGGPGRGRGRRDCGAGAADAEPDQRAGDGQHDEPEGQQAEGDPQHGARAAADADVGDHARRAVGLHDQGAPLALVGLPLDPLRARAGGRGRPEVLARRRLGAVGAGRAVIRDVAAVDVGDLVVGDAGQVGVDVGLRGDPDEQRLVAGSGGGDARGDVELVEDPVAAPLDVAEVELLPRQRRRRGGEPLGRRGEEAVVVARRRVGDRQRGAGQDEEESQEREQAADDGRDDLPR
jgi:hypothetical protein